MSVLQICGADSVGEISCWAKEAEALLHLFLSQLNTRRAATLRIYVFMDVDGSERRDVFDE